MIRYKVVWKDRGSFNRNDCFSLKYEKDKIVKAKDDTLGIFCFKTFYNAKNYCYSKYSEIIRVKPIGRGKIPKRIASRLTNDGIVSFYKNEIGYDTSFIPYGTICYPEVLVLD